MHKNIETRLRNKGLGLSWWGNKPLFQPCRFYVRSTVLLRYPISDPVRVCGERRATESDESSSLLLELSTVVAGSSASLLSLLSLADTQQTSKECQIGEEDR